MDQHSTKHSFWHHPHNQHRVRGDDAIGSTFALSEDAMEETKTQPQQQQPPSPNQLRSILRQPSLNTHRDNIASVTSYTDVGVCVPRATGSPCHHNTSNPLTSFLFGQWVGGDRGTDTEKAGKKTSRHHPHYPHCHGATAACETLAAANRKLYRRPNRTSSSASTTESYIQDDDGDDTATLNDTIARKYLGTYAPPLYPLKSAVASTMSASSYTNSEDLTTTIRDEDETMTEEHTLNENLNAATRYKYIQEFRQELNSTQRERKTEEREDVPATLHHRTPSMQNKLIQKHQRRSQEQEAAEYANTSLSANIHTTNSIRQFQKEVKLNDNAHHQNKYDLDKKSPRRPQQNHVKVSRRGRSKERRPTMDDDHTNNQMMYDPPPQLMSRSPSRSQRRLSKHGNSSGVTKSGLSCRSRSSSSRKRSHSKSQTRISKHCNDGVSKSIMSHKSRSSSSRKISHSKHRSSSRSRQSSNGRNSSRGDKAIEDRFRSRSNSRSRSRSQPRKRKATIKQSHAKHRSRSRPQADKPSKRNCSQKDYSNRNMSSRHSKMKKKTAVPKRMDHLPSSSYELSFDGSNDSQMEEAYITPQNNQSKSKKYKQFRRPHDPRNNEGAIVQVAGQKRPRSSTKFIKNREETSTSFSRPTVLSTNLQELMNSSSRESKELDTSSHNQEYYYEDECDAAVLRVSKRRDHVIDEESTCTTSSSRSLLHRMSNFRPTRSLFPFGRHRHSSQNQIKRLLPSTKRGAQCVRTSSIEPKSSSYNPFLTVQTKHSSKSNGDDEVNVLHPEKLLSPQPQQDCDTTAMPSPIAQLPVFQPHIPQYLGCGIQGNDEEEGLELIPGSNGRMLIIHAEKCQTFHQPESENLYSLQSQNRISTNANTYVVQQDQQQQNQQDSNAMVVTKWPNSSAGIFSNDAVGSPDTSNVQQHYSYAMAVTEEWPASPAGIFSNEALASPNTSSIQQQHSNAMAANEWISRPTGFPANNEAISIPTSNVLPLRVLSPKRWFAGGPKSCGGTAPADDEIRTPRISNGTNPMIDSVTNGKRQSSSSSSSPMVHVPNHSQVGDDDGNNPRGTQDSKGGKERNDGNGGNNDDVEFLPESLEEVIAAISKFKLQAEKLGLSDEKIIDVLNKKSAGLVRVSNNTLPLRPQNTAFVKSSDLYVERSSDRLNTTIAVQQQHETGAGGGNSEVSSITYRGLW